MDDPFNLRRFVDAQRNEYAGACAELRAGQKRGHWIWFIFPQMRGLGSSPTSQFFGISSLGEAVEYAKHPVLGARIEECAGLVNQIEGRTAHQIFGSPDDMKFKSSMTLFALAAPEKPVFRAALEKHYGGELDQRTLELLGREA